MKNPLRTEPAAISGAIVAVLNALVLLNVLNLTVDQISGINIAVIAVLTLFVRQTVTPNANITSDDPVVPADPPAKLR